MQVSDWTVHIARTWDVRSLLVHPYRYSFYSRCLAHSPYTRGSSTSSHRPTLSIVRILSINFHSSLNPSWEVTERIDLDASYPSSLADGGCVRCSKACLDPSGNLYVSFPDIRWVINVYHAVFSSEKIPPVGLLYVQRRDGPLYNIMLSCAPWSLFSRLVLAHNYRPLFRISLCSSRGVLTSPLFPSMPKESTRVILYLSGIQEIFTTSMRLRIL